MTFAPLPDFRLESREPLEVELTRKLIEYLSSSGLQPGQRLPSERQLSEALGIGRTALRNAIKSLNLLGVVDVRPSTGTFLNDGQSDLLPQVIEWGILLGGKRLDEVIEARSAVEITLAGYAAERRTEDDLARLRAIAKRMEHPAAADDYVGLDVEFHLAIADAAHNSVLLGVMRSLQSLLRVWATRVIYAAGETSSSFAMHTPILAAIESGDAAAARAAMEAHSERGSRRLRETIESSGQ